MVSRPLREWLSYNGEQNGKNDPQDLLHNPGSPLREIIAIIFPNDSRHQASGQMNPKNYPTAVNYGSINMEPFLKYT